MEIGIGEIFVFARTTGTLVTLRIWEKKKTHFPSQTRSRSPNFPYYRLTEMEIPCARIIFYDIIATIMQNGRKKKKKNWKLAAINTRPSDKGKSKVGQELYIEADNRQVGIIGDDKSIPAYYRNAIIEMCALVIACTDPCSTFEQLSLILSDKSWRSFKVEMIPAIVTKGQRDIFIYRCKRTN